MRVRSGPPAGTDGHFHEAALYSSDEEYLAIVAPFVEGGLEHGEPVIVSCPSPQGELLRQRFGHTSSVVFTGPGDHATPASSIRTYRARFAELVAGGAAQIRVVGEVPHPGLGAPWQGWARYEAAAVHAFRAFPVWGMCPYDLRITAPEVIADVLATHQHLGDAHGAHERNDRYVEPASFLRARSHPPDPIELAPPTIELRDCSPETARRAIGILLELTALDTFQRAGIALAVSETVTNAMRYGAPPVITRCWIPAPTRVVITVADAGAGPDDPFVGLWSRDDGAPGGLGLWITNQVCSEVAMRSDADGFVIRLNAGDLTA